jgi:hypothetical protein
MIERQGYGNPAFFILKIITKPIRVQDSSKSTAVDDQKKVTVESNLVL